MKTNNKDNTNLGWNFDNTYVNLPEILYSKQEPIPVKLSKLIIFNRSLSDSLGLNSHNLESNKGAEIFAGSRIPEGSTPIAQAYAGHQFGHFTKLGDGRAVLLGEHVTPKGKRFDIQLKGSGRTRYSRGGDGRAAIGPMLREYIMSEAIHNLGIPTTRSLAVVTTGEKIIRESHLPGAILTRVASSHIRVGTFQYLSVFADNETLREFADYTIQRHYPNLATEGDKYLLFLKEVVKNQAKLISKWQLVGFIHGVMNTDNMTISGETIDYGPCAFMDKYNLSTVFSSIDRAGRYAYGNQPQIAAWNLARFSETLLPLLNDNEDRAIELATNEVSEFYKLYNGYWLEGMKKKLGLVGKKHEDEKLIEDLLNIMEKYQVDYTNTFRELTLGELDEMDIFKTKEFSEWKLDWEKRLSNQKNSEEDVKQLMKDNNPAVIPRNHRVEEALEVAYQGDLRVMESLLKVLENPYAYSHEQVEYSKLPPTSSVPYRTFCGT